MLASVIIPVKNGKSLLASVMKAVQGQIIDGEYEVIIIDSGSSDGSRELVLNKYSDFRLVDIEPSSFGHGRTRNLGVGLSKGQFCAFLTHDALPINEHWLSELLKPLRADQQVAGVFGRHIAYPEADPFTTWELDTHFLGLSEWPVAWISDAREYARNEGLRKVFHFYSDNSSCLRRSVWEQIPYPEVDFAEDQLWAKEIVEAGYKKAFSFDSVVYHSHNYSIIERVRRSYDESRALYELFGYELCPNLAQACYQSVMVSLRDARMSKQKGWIWSHPIATLRRPLYNFAHQLGLYLGNKNPMFIAKRQQIFSRDRALKAHN